jgi:putative YhbY family RNA-binding protein
MTALTLTTAARREHRANAHHLDPVVAIGNDGLTPAVEREIDLALNAHGLIKVRVFSDDRDNRNTIFASLADSLGAAPVQHIGKLLVLWRPMPEKQKVEPEQRMPGPRMVKLVKFSKSGNHRPTVKTLQVFGNQRVAAGGELKRARKRQVSLKKRSQSL